MRTKVGRCAPFLRTIVQQLGCSNRSFTVTKRNKFVSTVWSPKCRRIIEHTHFYETMLIHTQRNDIDRRQELEREDKKVITTTHPKT
eukprot:c15462_g1_i1 orf=18-278(-)